MDVRRQLELGHRLDEGQHVPRVGGVTKTCSSATRNFNTNGHDQKILLPQLNYLSFQDQQSARANRRLDVAYGADNVFAWFVPGKGGDHDMKFGVNYLYSSLRNEDYGNQNGTFTFNTDLPFDASNPADLPRAAVRFACPGAVELPDEGALHRAVRAGQVADATTNFTLNLGARYDVEILPTPNQDNPLFEGDPGGYPSDLNNISPRLGLFMGARRRGPLGACAAASGVFFQRTSYTFLTDMFANGAGSPTRSRRNFPTNNADTGPRDGNFPTDPMLVNGPHRQPRAASTRCSLRARAMRNGGTVRFDNPDRDNAYVAAVQPRLRAPGRNQHRAQRRLHPLRAAQPVHAHGAQPAACATHRSRPAQSTRNQPAGRHRRRVGGERRHARQRGLHRLQHRSRCRGRSAYSNGWPARLSYAFSRGRGNTPTGQAAVAKLAVPRRSAISTTRSVRPTSTVRTS